MIIRWPSRPSHVTGGDIPANIDLRLVLLAHALVHAVATEKPHHQVMASVVVTSVIVSEILAGTASSLAAGVCTPLADVPIADTLSTLLTGVASWGVVVSALLSEISASMASEPVSVAAPSAVVLSAMVSGYLTSS